MEYKAIPSDDLEHSSVPIDLFSWTSSGDEDPSITVISPRKLIADKFEGFGIPPIGTILPWHKDLTGTPALPEGWAELNGQTISDADSVYDGVTLPDLNGDGRFLRGGGTSGVEQEDQFQDHGHKTDGKYPRYETGTPTYDIDLTNTNAYYVAHGVTDPREINGNGTPRVGNETYPKNMSVVFIIRIK